ncbi:alcohol dehydrogenase catalytic domain-containing protein [Acidianus sulfidivorans JP7]|uniref:Alcohol dehydrogenase n=1 Tax=Acidianus sulfidivorans JP7 TaxID=619593 RepID=A0A2U9IK31_9CREN|nr:alcohol dehydrogenase catalytic domain-containing protein [Acidianus sulfidivorans]AWR96326.1 alcohol dehydrogenase catalytic domain-containing protein [Acidianus sulfidivorans JP7]
MKALFFEKNGIENLKFGDYQEPEVDEHSVKLKVIMAGVNPIDYFVVSSIPANPMPHIPGAEIYGVVEKVGSHVKDVKEGDRVVVYNRVFDGSCDMCLSSKEMLCRNGGIMSIITNGGYSEYFVVPSKNVFKIPDEISDELAASLPVAGLTAYHAIKEANVSPNSTITVFGASGNTGQFATQLAKKFGARVIAVSSKEWVKDYGVDYVVSYNNATEEINKITNGKKSDIVVNSVGSSVWDISMQVLGVEGKIVFFGGLTGSEVKLNLGQIYGTHAKIIGTTGGSRKDLTELIQLCKDSGCKVKVWKTFSLEEGQKALNALFDKNRDGRILLKIS